MDIIDHKQLERAFIRAGLLGDAGRQNSMNTVSCSQAEQIASELNVPLREVEWFALERGVVPLRYALNLGTFTIPGQQKLLKSRVLVVGLGGLGGHVVELLARSGVGRIAAADPDIFEDKNLNRQILSTLPGLGRKKVAEAAERLRQINAAVEFTGYALKFQQLDDDVFKGLDLVFDCLDNAADRLVLEMTCSSKNLVLIHAAIGGWFGQVGMVWPDTGLMQKTFGDKQHGIEKSLGNPPFTPAVTAGIAATLGIKFLLGKITQRSQKLWFIDLLDDDWETIDFPRLP